MTDGIPEPSFERQRAGASYPAELMNVGNHISGSFADTVVTLTRPAKATHLRLQALGENLRYRIDDVDPTASTGFQLAALSDTLIPCPNRTIRIISEVPNTGTYEAIWVV